MTAIFTIVTVRTSESFPKFFIPVHNFTSYFSQIYFNIILPNISRLRECNTPPPSQILKLILPPACHIIMDDIYELQNYWSLIVAHTNTFTGAWPDRRHLRLVAARVFSRGDLLWGSKRLLNTGTAPLISRQSARIHCAALGGRCVGSEGDPTKS
jgi:hypothetical protein